MWKRTDATKLKKLAGVYKLAGGCWAVLKIEADSHKNPTAAQKTPEGYVYTWAVLAPGKPPKLRGHRMAGIDNADDKRVRDQIKANPKGPQHRAHRHHPNWKDTKVVRDEEWPVAGPGIQLKAAPASPEEFWQMCTECLNDVLDELGLDVPDEMQLLNGRMIESDFYELQKEHTQNFEVSAQ